MERQAVTINFVDIDTNDDGVVILRIVKDKIAFTLSLMHGSDTEATLSVQDFNRLFAAFQEINTSLNAR